tara:strand:- start:47 stop:598 length:552 start_codon:yes stop_codon:yes gene_type:complete
MKLSDDLLKRLYAASEYMEDNFPARKFTIAGGCLRDDLLGRPVKDIDIFIHGFSTDPVPEGCEDAGERNAYLMFAKTVYVGSEEINLIFLRGEWCALDVAARCDIGICQVAWTKGTGLVYTDAFVKDVVFKTLTVTRNTSLDHVERVERKFYDFESVRGDYQVTNGNIKGWHYNSATGKVELK